MLFNSGTPACNNTDGAIVINAGGSSVEVNIPADNSGIVDDIIDVPIIVDDLTGLGVLAYQTTITYDASVVEAIGIETTGTLSSTSGWTVLPNTGTAGEIRIGGFGASDLSGGGVLVYMKFHLIGEAGTSTDLHFSEMLFNNGTPACNTTDGAIVINYSPPNVPILKSPINYSVGITVPVNLVWNSSESASSYKLQVSVLSDFSTLFVDESSLTDTLFTLNDLNNLTTYYWRVKAVNVNGESNWSEVWNFKTLGEPVVVELLLPLDGDVNQPTSLNLVWSQSHDSLKTVSAYWLQLSTEITSGNYEVNDTTLADTSYFVEGLNNLTQYYWRVCAKNEVGWGIFSNWSSFSTIPPTPGTVELISPVDSLLYDTTSVSTDFIWKSVENGEYYQIQLSYYEDFSNSFYSNDSLADTTFTFTERLTGSFYWRVRGVNIAGSGVWSSNYVRLILTGIDDNSGIIPISYSLKQNYPNPFNPSTIIRYGIPEHSSVKLSIFNMLGQQVSELINEEQSAGNYREEFNATNLTSGIYFYRLEAISTESSKKFISTKKMLLIK